MMKADEVVKDVNSWAKLQTNGLIKRVLQPADIHPLTALVLGNALYFKGCWKDEFNPTWTKKRKFYLLNGDKISIPFMTTSQSYLYGSFENFKVLDIPYQSGRKNKKRRFSMQIPDQSGHRGDHKQFSMQFLLPNEKDGLQNLLEKLNADSSGFFNQLHFHLKKADLDEFWIPKFKFS
ncbi:hypothetical protein ACH5RR_018891 [Cinchona calisaya]|uniref:Serpin domain-containing protein n=1 Tax=Cinchona calisaya TaxID=153742 RepID=A0ABD2ZRE3_9GENT